VVLAVYSQLLEPVDQLYLFLFLQVMLGSGDPAFEGWMRSTESSYKDKFRGWVGFSVPVSHRITAGYAMH
jgi:glycogen synthase